MIERVTKDNLEEYEKFIKPDILRFLKQSGRKK